jgi:hypothetical protein
MCDEAGHPVLSQEALEMRDTLVEQVGALPIVESALDHIIGHFGPDAVAEVTGRSRRIIVDVGGRQRIENRSARTNLAETDAFMRGAKILIFSDAGGTGRSYHASLSAENQSRRIHYLLEPGWRADAAIQGLGRTHRTHQAAAPLFPTGVHRLSRRTPVHFDDRATARQPWCTDPRPTPNGGKDFSIRAITSRATMHERRSRHGFACSPRASFARSPSPRSSS